MSAKSNSIVDRNRLLLLRAALGKGQQAADAYREWRTRVPLDDIDFSGLRVLPHLVETATRHGIDDAELPRIRGAAKHTWIQNMLRTRALSRALAALQHEGVEFLLFKGAALFARYPKLAALRGAGDYDILVERADGPRAINVLLKVGFQSELCDF